MAQHRSTRVAEAIRDEVGSLLLHKIKDARVDSSRVSVINVEVTGDLRHATVFVSVLGDSEQQDATLAGLRSAAGYMRSEVGKAIQLRSTPELHFKLDHSIERGANIMALLNQIKEERDAKEAEADHEGGNG